LHTLQAKDSIGVPVAVSARTSLSGGTIQWVPPFNKWRGFNVYENNIKINHHLVAASQPAFAWQGSGSSIVHVTAVDSAGNESGFSPAIKILKGKSDTVPPTVVLISPPTVVQQGSLFEVKLRLIDDAIYKQQQATMYLRMAGQKIWQKITMERKTKAIFCAAYRFKDAGLAEFYFVVSDGQNQLQYPVGAPVKALTCIVMKGTPLLTPSLPIISIKGKSININYTHIPKNAWCAVYRSSKPGFICHAANRVTLFPAAAVQQFTDNGLDFDGQPLQGKYYYKTSLFETNGMEQYSTGLVEIEW
jgi:hypothetical protein